MASAAGNLSQQAHCQLTEERTRKVAGSSPQIDRTSSRLHLSGNCSSDPDLGCGLSLMGDVLQIRDYQLKRGLKPVETPLEQGLKIIVNAMSEHNAAILERIQGVPGNISILTPEQAAAFGNPNCIDDIPWPGMDSANYVAPDRDPA